MTERVAQEIIDKAMKMVKDEDVVHKGFLKPIEIALKTAKTEIMEDDNRMKEGSLADGLKIAVSISPDSQKRVLQDIM